MPHLDHEYQQPVIQNLVNNSVGTHADAPKGLIPGELNAARRAGMVGERENRRVKAALNIGRQFLQHPLCGAEEFDFIH